MTPARPSEEFLTIFRAAVRLADAVRVDAILLLLVEPLDWQQLKELSGAQKILLAADNQSAVTGAAQAGFASVILPDTFDTPVPEKLRGAY